MVLEKLIPKKYKYSFHQVTNEISYRYVTDSPREYSVQAEYWYDGRLFLVGKFPGLKLSAIEIETGAYAVSPEEDCKTLDEIISRFKFKLQRTNKTIHEVIRDYKSKNKDLETWLVKLLTI